jgi:hypothetical protein
VFERFRKNSEMSIFDKQTLLSQEFGRYINKFVRIDEVKMEIIASADTLNELLMVAPKPESYYDHYVPPEESGATLLLSA